MPDLEAEKALVAARSVEEVQSGMLVGLGSGSTMGYAIRALARRVAGGLEITATSSSTATEELATSLGITVTPFQTLSRLDLTIDGADEIDASFRAIKGGGGALLREKILATAAERVIIIVDSSKPVAQLGRFKLPVEVLSFADAFAMAALRRLGAPVSLRLKDGVPLVTDQGAHIYDIAFERIEDPLRLARDLDAIPGVIEHGLFLDEIDEVMVGRNNQVEVQKRPKGRVE
jgi:ribose 5-phosphate isomerase A